MLTIAQKVANESGLTKSTSGYEFYSQNQITNDDLIDLIQEEATGCYSDELWVFSDGSCVNRQDDEYFLNDDVDMLAHEFLTEVGYL
jgi:hypothetical protein